jgi:hypothetical protein
LGHSSLSRQTAFEGSFRSTSSIAVAAQSGNFVVVSGSTAEQRKSSDRHMKANADTDYARKRICSHPGFVLAPESFQGSSNLTFYQHDMADCFRFQIDGEFHDSLVRELDGCWQTARSTVSDRPLIVDLRFVTSWGDPAVELLGRMHQAGAKFMALPGQSAQLTELITGVPQELEAPAAVENRHSVLVRKGLLQKVHGWFKPARQLQLPS